VQALLFVSLLAVPSVYVYLQQPATTVLTVPDGSTAQEQPDADGGIHHPQVAWIMSFGGSGTSYTIVNTEAMTLRSTASNYGQEFRPHSVPIRANYTNGPFVRSPRIGLPDRYVLTKTHCGG
jgi:hypothetical protein